MPKYDIAIIGAGPAGSTLARLLSSKYRVLLLDKRPLQNDSGDSVIRKACGGLIAPDAQKMLAHLGLGVPQKVLVGQQLFVVRTIDMDNHIERFYQRHYLNIDREKFDRWLVSLIPPGVDMDFGCSFKSLEKTDQGYRIRFLNKGREYFEEARIVVGADGASSRVRKLAVPQNPVPKTYISIQEWFEGESLMPYFSAVFDKEITDFYSWTIPKDNFLIVGSALEPRNQAHEKFALLKSKMGEYGFKLGKRVKREGALILRPQNAGQIAAGTEGIALIGEAAGWISPSSAEGLSYAFWSALALAESLEPGPEAFLKRYEVKTAGLRKNIRVKNLKEPFMYNTLIRKMVMLSGLQSMDITSN